MSRVSRWQCGGDAKVEGEDEEAEWQEQESEDRGGEDSAVADEQVVKVCEIKGAEADEADTAFLHLSTDVRVSDFGTKKGFCALVRLSFEKRVASHLPFLGPDWCRLNRFERWENRGLHQRRRPIALAVGTVIGRRLANGLSDRLADWVADWLADGLADWYADGPARELTDGFVDRPATTFLRGMFCLFFLLTDLLTDLLKGARNWPDYWPDCSPADLLTGAVMESLICWPAGRLGQVCRRGRCRQARRDSR